MESVHNRKSVGLVLVALLLFVCVMATLAVLVSRVVGYTKAEYYNMVELDGHIIESEMEIFHLTYDNASGVTTVKGIEGNTDKLIAPGTSNRFEFTLHNILEYPVTYFMTMEARVDGTDLWLPVEARVWDGSGRYLLGDAADKADVLALNTVADSGALDVDGYAPYTLEWEWPFEWGDDEYDTMLGNLSVEDDIGLTVIIRVLAEYDIPDDPTPGAESTPSAEPTPGTESTPTPPGSGTHDTPKTGDDAQIVLFALVFVGSLTGLCVVLPASGRKRKRAEDNERNEA